MSLSLKEQMIRYRAKHDLTMREMADRVGVSLQTIMMIEHGMQNPSRLTEEKIKIVLEGEENGD